jgi:hypothetical protein
MKKIVLSLMLITPLSNAMELVEPAQSYAEVYRQPGATLFDDKVEIEQIKNVVKIAKFEADGLNKNLEEALRNQDWTSVAEFASYLIEKDVKHVVSAYASLGCARTAQGNITQAEEAFHAGLQHAKTTHDIGCLLYNLIMIFDKKHEDFCATSEYQAHLDNPHAILEAALMAHKKKNPQRLRRILKTIQSQASEIAQDETLQKYYDPLIHAFFLPEKTDIELQQLDMTMLRAMAHVYFTTEHDDQRDRCMKAMFKKIMTEHPNPTAEAYLKLLNLSYWADDMYGLIREERPPFLMFPDSIRSTGLLIRKDINENPVAPPRFRDEEFKIYDTDKRDFDPKSVSSLEASLRAFPKPPLRFQDMPYDFKEKIVALNALNRPYRLPHAYKDPNCND